MKSLFEAEEKENAINQLKIDLISRYFPFSNDEIKKYQKVLNFDRDHLMDNDSVQWNNDLIEELKDKLDWSAIWKLKNIKLDLQFCKKFENWIDFTSIHYSKNVEWTEELVDTFGDRLDWSITLITLEPLSTLKNLRKYSEKLDWAITSRRLKLTLTDEIIEEFKNLWVWKKLSANPNLPVTVDFIKKYIDKLDFDALSRNPASLPLIYKYPGSTRWNWDEVIKNYGLIYNQEIFDFMFANYTKRYEQKEIVQKEPIKKIFAMSSFLSRVFQSSFIDISFLLNKSDQKYFPWYALSRHHHSKLSFEFIVANKNKLDFKENGLINSIKDTVTLEFVEQNQQLFDKDKYQFFYLPLSIDLIMKYSSDIKWNCLSHSEKLDWSWDFIEEHFSKFNYCFLSMNRGIYEKLIQMSLTKVEVLALLENQLLNTRPFSN